MENFTGCTLVLKLSGIDETTTIKTHDRAYIENGVLKDGIATLDLLVIDRWDTSNTTVKLPHFGSVNIGVSTAEASQATMFITLFSRLENPRRQHIVLRSNTFFCNHSYTFYEVKYLRLGFEGRKAVESQVVKFRPNERMSLPPLLLLMGITEYYARSESHEHWFVNTSLKTMCRCPRRQSESLTSTKQSVKERQISTMAVLVTGHASCQMTGKTLCRINTRLRAPGATYTWRERNRSEVNRTTRLCLRENVELVFNIVMLLSVSSFVLI